MPLALTAYLTSSPSLRAPLYYSTWGLYYASYAVSPGLVTLLQVLILALTWGLPRLEVATARGRVRLASSEWATTQFRDEFVDPNAPPAEWPGWLKTTGNALDVRWVGSSAWEGVSGFFKSVGGWFGGWFGGGKAAAPATTDVALSAFRAPSFRAPSLPAHAASVAPSAFTARPPSHRVATMPAHAAVAPGSAKNDRGSVWSGSGWKKA
ncbi:hypothetical protein JCM10207_000909 [Rhodosporidiobolus poonsookiae]